MASISQSVTLSHQENQTCLCDSICQASAQVQWHPFTSVAGKYALVLHAEIVVLLVKEAIETASPAEMKKGFCSPYFIVPKKGGGLQPIIDLRDMNRALHRLPFKKHILG